MIDVIYKGRQITSLGDGAPFIVKVNGFQVTSQPTLDAAKDYIDNDIAGARRLLAAIFAPPLDKRH